RLRVATLCLSGVGGSGIVAADVASGLAERGHEVHLLSDRPPFRLEDLDVPVRLHTADIPHAPSLNRPPITLALASKLAELTERFHIQVIHVHYAVPNAVAAQLARGIVGSAAPPLVVTLHGTDVTPVGASPAYRGVTRRALLDAAQLTAPSHHLAVRTEEVMGPLPREVRVIPNFVDLERFSPQPTTSCGHRSPFTAIHVSNFRPVKRAADAVRAFAALPHDLPARLVMIGDGPERPAVEALVRRLRLAERVRFLGVRHDVARYLARAHVALVPSGAESFGLSALEALAVGLPVVATRVGGLPDVVRDGETGLLADVGDVNQLGAHLLRLAREPELCARLGAAGRRDAQERFRPERALEAYESVLRSAVAADRKETIT
ncbi:MAG: N-acetyl-alpha-D-glucosaminyl L-malate synthase BshA, partial [Myxococcota bacterium]